MTRHYTNRCPKSDVLDFWSFWRLIPSSLGCAAHTQFKVDRSASSVVSEFFPLPIGRGVCFHHRWLKLTQRVANLSVREENRTKMAVNELSGLIWKIISVSGYYQRPKNFVSLSIRRVYRYPKGDYHGQKNAVRDTNFD